MTQMHPRRNVKIEEELHPTIFRALIACVVWIVSALWLFFGYRDGYVGLQLAIATVFCVMFVAVPLWMHRLSGHPNPDEQSFREWASHEFDTANGPVEGREAALMVLLAPAALVLGITGVSLVAFLAGRGLL